MQSVKVGFDGEFCAYCRTFRDYSVLNVWFVPETEFTAESTTWFCRDSDECNAMCGTNDRAAELAEVAR